jgi:hypothetical protein
LNSHLLIPAALLTIIVALTHSILGEVLIFSRLRTGSIIPTQGGSLLRERHVRILWASWHVVSIFGFAMAAVIWRLSAPTTDPVSRVFVTHSFAMAMLLSSLLVLIATKAKHPGWFGLLGVAVLLWWR